MKTKVIFILLFWAYLPAVKAALNTSPIISNLRVNPNSNENLVEIQYDLADKENKNVFVKIEFFNAETNQYLSNNDAVKGDLGMIEVGNSKKIIVDVSKLPFGGSSTKYRISADDLQKPTIQEIINQVDSFELKQNLYKVIGIRNPTTKDGAEKIVEVRNFIEANFREDKLETKRQLFDFASYEGENIFSRKNSAFTQEQAIVVGASYDTNWMTPGANSNGSGLIGMLQIAKILSKYQFKKPLVFVGFDCSSYDEYMGSSNFVFKGGLGKNEKIFTAFNLDNIGHFSEEPDTYDKEIDFVRLFPEEYSKIKKGKFRTDFMRIITNHHSRPMADKMKEVTNRYLPDLKIIMEDYAAYGECIKLDCEYFKTQQSDHIPFWYGRQKALFVTNPFTGDYPANSLDDKVELINFAYYTKVVKAVLATVAEMAEIQSQTVIEGELLPKLSKN